MDCRCGPWCSDTASTASCFSQFLHGDGDDDDVDDSDGDDDKTPPGSAQTLTAGDALTRCSLEKHSGEKPNKCYQCEILDVSNMNLLQEQLGENWWELLERIKNVKLRRLTLRKAFTKGR